VNRRFIAQQALENVLEEYSQQPWEAITAESVQKINLPDFAADKLPRSEVSGEVVEETDPVQAKRIVLRLAWSDYPGQTPQTIALTTWSFPAEEQGQ
jgi:hypothetical protein